MRREAEPKSHLGKGLVWTAVWTFGIGDYLRSQRSSSQAYLEIRLEGDPVDEDNESPRSHKRCRGAHAVVDHGGGLEIVLVGILGRAVSGLVEPTRAFHLAAFEDIEPRTQRLRSA